jgi:hypothetical protein
VASLIQISLRALAFGLTFAASGASSVFAQTPAPAQSYDDHGAHHPGTNADPTPVTPPVAGSVWRKAGEYPWARAARWAPT